jgi:alkylation response protein AidB-like acyl-CoA dehydrogenase
MDLAFTPEEETFRQQVRTWLEEHLPRDYDPDEYFSTPDVDKKVEIALAWQKKLYQGGWAGLNWPKEYGGRGATVIEQHIFNQELGRARAPMAAINFIGVAMVGPTIIHWGTEEQKKRYLPKILSSEEIWCQGFSEPGAGSDLAALSTYAEEREDHYVVNGQKTWTSLAHYSDLMYLLARTNKDVKKHKGLSAFAVDMKSPGITVRPLVQLTGESDFNEVFFEDVIVPKENRIGPQDQGWDVAITTLMYERAGMGAGMEFEHVLNQLLSLAAKVQRGGVSASQDPWVRQRIAQFIIEWNAVKYTDLRALSKQVRGEPPGWEGSICKLGSSYMHLRLTSFATELLGPYGQLTRDCPHSVDQGAWIKQALSARAFTIGGGTSEIQRSILATRALGLPRK